MLSVSRILLVWLVTFTQAGTVGLYAQEPKASTFNLRLLTAIHSDTIHRNSVLAIFGVTPIKMRDFPPALSMGIGFSLNGETKTTRVDLMDQKIKGHIQLQIIGKNIVEEAPALYELVKEKIKQPQGLPSSGTLRSIAQDSLMAPRYSTTTRS